MVFTVLSNILKGDYLMYPSDDMIYATTVQEELILCHKDSVQAWVQWKHCLIGSGTIQDELKAHYRFNALFLPSFDYITNM
jgi:hypothetical protein